MNNGNSLGRFKPQKHDWDPTSAQLIRSSYQKEKFQDSSWAVFSSHQARLLRDTASRTFAFHLSGSACRILANNSVPGWVHSSVQWVAMSTK